MQIYLSPLFSCLKPVSPLNSPNMPKAKSHSGAKKRIRRTGSGKIAMKRGRRNHLLMQKSTRQKKLSRTLLPEKSEKKRIVSLLPYL